jgi:DNA-binding NarL/FixJ family response regulator
VGVVAEVDEVDAACELIVERRLDVDFLDVHLPWAGGGTVIEAVMPPGPDVRFLALSVPDVAEDVIATIRAGVRGYVTKTISGPDLVDAVRRVAGGDVVFSLRLEGFLLDAFIGRDGVEPEVVGSLDPEIDLLAPREGQVPRLIARGYSYRAVAGRLGISTKTVEGHVSAVLRKLQLPNQHQLSRWASERCLV